MNGMRLFKEPVSVLNDSRERAGKRNERKMRMGYGGTAIIDYNHDHPFVDYFENNYISE
jgi:hypothetical protein